MERIADKNAGRSGLHGIELRLHFQFVAFSISPGKIPFPVQVNDLVIL